MRLKNFNLILMLVAGIIVGVISIIFSYSLERLMFTLFIVLGCFYLLGSVIQLLINRIYESTVIEEREKQFAELDEAEKELTQKDNIGDLSEKQRERQ